MNDIYEVQFSVIKPEALRSRVLSRYNLHDVICRFYTQGVNDIYIVTCHEGTYYLKLSLPGYKNKDEIEGEVIAVNELVKQGVSVAAPVADREGIYVHEIQAPEGIRYVVLWKEAKGEIKGIKTKEESNNLGKLLAQMHTQLDGIHVTRHRLDANHLVSEPLKYVTEFYQDTEYPRRLEEAGGIILSYLKDRMVDGSEGYGLCHGDIHNYNIRFEGSHPTIFDFDCAGYGLRAYDLAVQRWNIAMFQLDKEKEEEQWNDLLEGYSTIRNIEPKDLSNINILVAARNLWLTGLQLKCLHYNRGCDWMNEDFIKWNTEFIEKWIDA